MVVQFICPHDRIHCPAPAGVDGATNSNMSSHACARPSARRGESLQIQQHALGKFGMHARVSHILLSLLGPVYFGFLHSPYVVLVVWSAACAAIFFWSNRA